MLTSLVDAFSIIVIFLIVVTTSSSAFEIEENITLPQVTEAGAIADVAKITVTQDSYRYEHRQYGFDELRQRVIKDRQNFPQRSAVVEADKSVPYGRIEPVLRLFAELEIETIHMAVESGTTL
jgi:biopolymer transport protein ExbD